MQTRFTFPNKSFGKYGYLLVFVILVMACSRDRLPTNDSCADISCQNNGTCVNGTCECPEGFTGVSCEVSPSSLELRAQFGSTETLKVEVDGIFAYWWDLDFDHANEISVLKKWMNDIRADLNGIGIKDPSSFSDGYFTNIYIHHGEEDILPNYFGLGVGYDSAGFPYMTLPYLLAFTDHSSVLHEAFHIFQSSSGYDYVDTEEAAVWIIEALAEWYQMSRNSQHERSFIIIKSIDASPDLALWQYEPRVDVDLNGLTEDQQTALGWIFGIRQYANAAFLYYLTDIKNVDVGDVIGSMFDGKSITPQQYLFDQIGSEILRDYYTEWAAHNVAGYDYITESQLEIAEDEYDFFVENLPAGHAKPFVHELQNHNAVGTYRPEVLYRPKAWGYNVIKVNNSEAATYTFSLNGDTKGSEGADAHFEAQIVVKGNSTQTRFVEVDMSNATEGTVSVSVDSSETELYFVVAAVPEDFTGNQTYDYEVAIDRN